jgi:hypothetical protein
MLCSCKKLLDVPTPPGEVAIDDAFKDSSSGASAMAGIYNLMASHGYFEWGGLSYNTSRSADDAIDNIGLDFFSSDSLQYTDANVLGMWQQGFSTLLMVNTCIRGIASSNSLSLSIKNQWMGEALFCRAFINFNLVNLWGDALPLVTTPDVEINQVAKSVPHQQVYDQIITDLQNARGLLTNTYPSQGKVRPNIMAATALLARVYLYQNRYIEAIQQSSSVIESQLYSPLPAPENAFLRSSREAIWQLLPSTGPGETGSVCDVYIYQSGWSSLTSQLLASFEPGDLRRQRWVASKVFLGTTYLISGKYKDRGTSGNTNPSEYYIMLRLAEQYLIRAEAYARLGQTSNAIGDLNVLRNRAQLPSLPLSLSQDDCTKAVEQERRVELFTEWGHRWFDLKRWPGLADHTRTRADEIFSITKRDWQPTDKWYPVPQSELQVNPFLVQNPGYPVR